MGIRQYFSATYAEARRKFLEAAGAGGSAIESHVNPNAKGTNGEELATDVARFGGMDAENLFIVCSGTHGNEGFGGSGCQIGLIKEGIINARPQSVAVLLVHAVNPYGFSHIRRVTEDNVDLNRNFRDFSKPPPENPRYSVIHDLLVPTDWDGPARARAEVALKAWREANGGMPAYQAVVAGGQYSFPDGLFFGGQRATWSNQTFRAIVETHGVAAKRVRCPQRPRADGLRRADLHPCIRHVRLRARTRLVGPRGHFADRRHVNVDRRHGSAHRQPRGEPA
jgi:hypothetical protein